LHIFNRKRTGRERIHRVKEPLYLKKYSNHIKESSLYIIEIKKGKNLFKNYVNA